MTELSNHYGASAARVHGRPGRETRPASLTVDAHSHVLVPAAAKLVAGHLDPMSIPMDRHSSDDTRALNGIQMRDRTPNMLDAAVRLKDMAEQGIDFQLVMPPPPQCYYSVPEEFAVPATRVVNDGLAAFVAANPTKFAALGTVAMQAPQAAVEELRRLMGELGMKGVQLLTNVDGRELSDPDFAPFWAEAERLGAFVVIHPNGFTEGRRLERLYFNNVVGNPFETTLALHYLIFDGVLERHPNLKLMAVHGGGYLAAYSGRIDHAWGARSDVRAGLPKPPSEYLRRVYVDSVVFTGHQLDYLVRVFGADHVVLGTDYPYDMADSDPLGHLASATALDDAQRALIAGGNAKRILGLTVG